MQYALLVYSDQSSWEGIDEEEAARRRAESMPRWIALFEELGKVDPGALGRELEAATEAKVVRVVDGERVVTDGPFAETKEQLGGYYLIEAADLNDAIQVSARIPGAKTGSIEVRPIMVFSNQPS
jgi:hypothetical protein